MSMSKFMLSGLSAFFCGCALLAGLDDAPGDLGPQEPSARVPLDPEAGAASAPTSSSARTPELVTPTSGVVAMAVDDGAVYYALSHALLSVAIAGGKPRVLLDDILASFRVAEGEYGPLPLHLRGVAVNRERVFVVDESWHRIFACPKSGCTEDRGATIRLNGLSIPNAQIAVDDRLVVWGEMLGIGISTMPVGEQEIAAKYALTGSGEPKRIVSAVVNGQAAGVWLTNRDLFYGIAPRSEERLIAEPAVTDFAMTGASSVAYGINASSVFELHTKTRVKAHFADVKGVVLKRIVADATGIYVVGERPDTTTDLFEVKKDRADLVAHLGTVKALALGKTHVFYADEGGIYRVTR